MQELAAAIEASGLAGVLRASRWIYPAVNALHVLGVALPAFWLKMALVALGLVHALANPRVAAATRGRQRLAGALSLAVWIAVLGLGRLLGYL